MITRTIKRLKKGVKTQFFKDFKILRNFSKEYETPKKGSDRRGDTFSKKHTENNTFGFQSVDSTERQGLVNQVFNSVADSYDIMNDLMSVGVHRLWKEYFVNEIGMLKPIREYKDGEISSRKKCKVLDVAGGTGDIAFKIIDKQKKYIRDVENHLEVTVFDINGEMLRVGQERALEKGYDLNMLNFVEGNAERLEGIESDSIDVYTIAFGIRNVTNIPKALEEAHRVLRKGGRFLCLEFSKVQNPMFAKFYREYSFNVIPLVGQMVANDKDSYQYLVESIEKFHSQEDFKKLILEAGFKHVSYENLTNGVVAVHSGYKI